MTQRWKLTIEYDGTDFCGWQRQENGFSVQECLETAVQKFCDESVTAHVAGRTDAGVHATGQVAHIDLARDCDAKTVRDAINFHMRPYPAAVVMAEPVPSEFHARFNAVHRVYCYKFIMNRSAIPAIDNRYAWHVWQNLDLDAMNSAARHLIGVHDFTSFRAAECQAQSPVRSLNRVEFVENKSALSFGRHIEMWVEAKSFLHHQIRNFAGSLKLVGEGKWQPEYIRDVLDMRDRTKAGPMAPATGLHFVRVDY